MEPSDLGATQPFWTTLHCGRHVGQQVLRHSSGGGERACGPPTIGRAPSPTDHAATGGTSLDAFFLPTKNPFCPQPIDYPLFLHEDGGIGKNRLSKLHYRFQQYTRLIKTVQLESQILQSYESLLDIFRPNFEEDSHNFAGLEIQAKQS